MGKLMESFSPSSDGYQFMWLILAIGMIGLGFSLERFLYIVIKSGKGRGQFLADFGKLISAKQYDQALSVANSARYPIAKIMAAIVGAKDGGRDAMQSASDAVFLTEAPRLTRYLSIISVMASISTLLGLMGTIYGLIYTFDAMSNKPAAERPKALADGISIAMGTTLLGLCCAVPLLVCVGILNMNSERLIQEMEEKGLKIINSLS